MNKQNAREHFLKLRKELLYSDLLKADEAILERLLEIDFSKITYLHSYLPITKQNEINTIIILQAIKEKFTNIKVCVPVCDLKNNHLENVLYENTDLVLNSYNIPEPETRVIIDPIKIDLAIIPLLAFDHSGNRVGYGGGYYDRFLSCCRKDLIKVGLSYFPAIERLSDIENFDIPLDYCLTPDRTYTFNHL